MSPGPSVNLSALAEALITCPAEMGAWLDRQTGEVLILDPSTFPGRGAGMDEAPPASLAAWEVKLLPAMRAIRRGDPRYLVLPGPYDFHEYRHMERFIDTISVQHAAELWPAIKGKGAFRRFEHAARRLGLLEIWSAYRDAAARRFMLDWAHDHGVSVDESDRPAGGSVPDGAVRE